MVNLPGFSKDAPNFYIGATDFFIPLDEETERKREINGDLNEVLQAANFLCFSIILEETCSALSVYMGNIFSFSGL